MTAMQRWQASASGAVLGVIALFMVAAILGGAVAAIRANGTVDRFAAELTAARHQIDDLEADNVRLGAQNRQILEQNRTLVRFLRKHGLQVPRRLDSPSSVVPETVPNSSGGSTSDPKAPTPSPRKTSTPDGPGSIGTPTPTASPRTILGPVCDLLPFLCS